MGRPEHPGNIRQWVTPPSPLPVEERTQLPIPEQIVRSWITMNQAALPRQSLRHPKALLKHPLKISRQAKPWHRLADDAHPLNKQQIGINRRRERETMDMCKQLA